jgi:hypothetical protein
MLWPSSATTTTTLPDNVVVLECRPPGLALTRGQSQVGGTAPRVRHWSRYWAGWLITFIITGAVGDVAAYVADGYPATLTVHIRRWTGQEPRTRWNRVGQLATMTFLSWAAVHLGFGILGPSRGRPEE